VQPIYKALLSVIRLDLLIPLALVATYLGLIFIIRGVFPDTEELINAFSNLYSKYGYEIIFISAFLESLVLITYFVPGSFALALGVIFARTGVTDLTTVILTATVGTVLAYQLDYLLGYFGFGEVLKKLGYGNVLDQSKRQLDRFGKRGLILGFVHANIGSLLALAAGATNFPWPKFFVISLVSTLFWATAWGILIYSLGEIFLEILKKYSFLIFIFFVSLLMLSTFWREKRKGRK
jgi:membrane protein DedA with SNARE-associated domain